MTTMIRVEEWQFEQTIEPPEPAPREVPEGVEPPPLPEQPPAEPITMISVAVLSVWEGTKVEGEVCLIQQELAKEMDLDTSKAEEVVPEFQQRFVWEFPYPVVREALEAQGGTLISGREERDASTS